VRTAGAGSGGTSAGSGGTSAGNGGKSGSGGSASATFGVCTGTPANVATVYVIGDSTASVYASNLFPRMGWGQPLADLFGKACAAVSDKALSGRSSKSFYDEGAWTPVRSALKSGDYVLIQFGHNDEKSDEPTLYTDPQTTYKQYLTKYITEARAKQAVPVLLTSINRNSWSGTALKDTHGAYPPAMRELAAALDVDLIDMTALTKQYFERLGQSETTKLFMNLAAGQFPNYPNGNTDNTHLQETGARKIGQLALFDAYSQRLTLASLLKAVPSAP
jgi:lysophospholipase L1-like esterase